MPPPDPRVVQFARQVSSLEKKVADMKLPSLAYSAVEDGSLSVVVQDQEMMSVGLQFDGTAGSVVYTGPPPPQTTRPVVKGVLGGLEITWDGLWADEKVAPMDFSHMDIHITASSSIPTVATPPTFSIVSARGGTAFISRLPGEYNVVLIGRSHAGKGGPPSEMATATALGLPENVVDEPPGAVPAVKVEPFAIRALVASWEASELADAYDVYIDTDSGVEEIPERLVGRIQGNRVVISALGGSITPLSAVPYWVRVVPVNRIGKAPGTTSTTSTTPKLATSADISADFVYAGDISAITAQFGTLASLSAELGSVSVGPRISIEPPDIRSDGTNTGGITIFATGLDSAGQKVPLIQLHPDGSTFRGSVVSDDISILNGLVLQGTESHILANSGLTLDASIKDPSTAPSVIATTEGYPFASNRTKSTVRAIDWDPNAGCWWTLSMNGRYVYVDKVVGSTVTQTYTYYLALVPHVDANGTSYQSYPADVSGLARVGDKFFTWLILSNGGAAPMELTQVVSSGTQYVSRVFYDGGAEGLSSLARGDGGTTRLFDYFALSTNGNYTTGTGKDYANYAPTVSRNEAGTAPLWMAVAHEGGQTTFGATTANVGTAPNRAFTRIWETDTNLVTTRKLYRGLLELGVHKPGVKGPLVGLRSAVHGVPAGSVSGGLVLHHTGAGITHFHTGFPAGTDGWQLSGGTRLAEFEFPAETTIVGYREDGGTGRQGFYSAYGSASSRIQRYSTYYPAAGAASETWWVKYSFKNSSATTMSSPARSVAVAKRRFVQAQIPKAPVGAPDTDIFVGYGATAPLPAQYWERLEAVTSDGTSLLDGRVVTGNKPPQENTFGTSPPAWVRTSVGGFELCGDGTGVWPILEIRVRDQARSDAQTIADASAKAAVDAYRAEQATPVAGSTPYLSVARSNSQSIASDGTYQTVLFDTIFERVGLTYSTSNGRVTATEAGLYTVSSALYFASNATGGRAIRIYTSYDSGTSNPTGDLRSSIGSKSGSPTVPEITRTIRLAVGQYFRIMGYQDSGSTLTVANALFTRMTVVKVGT